MADINGVTLNAGSGPTVHYTITYSKNRPNNSQMTYNFTISAALGSSGSYIHSGYALLCTMTVNGSSAQVRIKAADGDDWDGTTPRLRYITVTCASTAGNTAQGVRFQVVSDGRLSLSSGVIDNSGYTVQSSELLTTACGAPTFCSVSPILAEGNVTLSWSGASSGISNAISSYEIQYSDSTDNTTWGAWAALTTVTTTASSGSVAVAPPPTRGNYRRFQVRTRGAAGASYYSGVESFHELRPQKYGAEARNVGGRLSRDLQQRDDYADLERSVGRHQHGQGLSDRQPHFHGQQHLERVERANHADTVGQRRQL